MAPAAATSTPRRSGAGAPSLIRSRAQTRSRGGGGWLAGSRWIEPNPWDGERCPVRTVGMLGRAARPVPTRSDRREGGRNPAVGWLGSSRADSSPSMSPVAHDQSTTRRPLCTRERERERRNRAVLVLPWFSGSSLPPQFASSPAGRRSPLLSATLCRRRKHCRGGVLSHARSCASSWLGLG